MGATNSRGRAFAAMNEEQALTPTTPRRDIAQLCSLPRNSPNHSHNQDRPEHQTSSSVFDDSAAADVSAADTNTPPDVGAADADSPAIDAGDQSVPVNGKFAGDPEYFDEVTPVHTKQKLNGKLAGGSEGQIKKKKLTSLLRTLSATAASSSARMSTRSAGDQSLMVETPRGHSELPEDEAEMKPNDVNNQSRSSSVRRMFNLPRGSPYTSSASASSKYSPMSED